MSIIATTLLWSALAAQSGGVELELQAVFGATGETYVQARTALVERGREVLLPVLLDRKAKSLWSEQSWREDAIVDALVTWVENPELARKLYALEGVDPVKYGMRRRPDPEVGRELKALVRTPGAAAILLELELKTAAVYPLVSAEPEVRVRELLALRSGVIVAIAGSKHPGAPLMLREVLKDGARSLAERRLAALGLGQTNTPGALVTLAPIAEDAEQPDALRSGAIAGLSQIRSLASVEVVSRIASRSTSAEVTSSAVAALGMLGNAWVAKRQPTPSSENIRKKASQTLLALLVGPEGAKFEGNLAEAMAMIAHPLLVAELEDLARDSARPEDVRSRAKRVLGRVELAASRAS